MRILAISDVEEPWLSLGLRAESLRDVDLVISCGDLHASYLTRIADLTNTPVAYVAGNHDSYAGEVVPGCVDLDNQIRDFHGLRILGLGGSMPYNSEVYGFTETQMQRRVTRLSWLAQQTGGVDLVVTHLPPAGCGDLDDFAHRGFSCFNGLLDKLQPQAMLHGHVHLSYGQVQRELQHRSGTRVINACGHTYLDIPGDAIPQRPSKRLLKIPKL